MKPYLLIALLLPLLLSAGCTDTQKKQTKAVILSSDLQVKYSASCQYCHEQTTISAPQKGSAAWKEILDKPTNETLARVINGHKGMPPLGQCFDCSEEDLEILVRYLAQEPTKTINSATP